MVTDDHLSYKSCTMDGTGEMHTRLKIALLAFANLIISVDYNIVFVALPAIGRDLGFAERSLQWIVSGYAVSYGGFLLLGGRLADRLGARRLFITALLVFGGASLIGGFAHVQGLLIAARVLQGLGGALLFPATLALVNTTFAEGSDRNRALAMWGVAGASGAVVGSMAGGVLTSLLGWPWVFFVNAPLTVAAAFLAVRVVPADPPPLRSTAFDVPGAVVVSAASSVLVLGLVTGNALTGTVGLALFGAFAVIERRSKHPLAPGSLFRTRGPLLAMVVVFLAMGPVNALHYVFYLHLESALGFGALAAGLAFVPMSVVAVLGSAKLLPVLLARLGPRPTIVLTLAGAGVGTALVAVGMLAGHSLWPLLPGMVLFGLSAGTFYPALFVAAGTGVKSDQQGMAAAVVNTSAQLGGAVGLAALLATSGGSLWAAAFSAAAVAGVGALLASVLPRPVPQLVRTQA
jgi:MFS family permease